MDRAKHANAIFSPYDLIPNGVIVLGPGFSVLFWNLCMAEWTGIPPEQIEGTNLLERYPTLKDPAVLIRVEQLFQGGPAVLFSPIFHPHLFPIQLPDGGLMVHKISFIPMNIDNRICAFVLIEDVSDLTNQVNAYRNMKKIVEIQLNELQKAQDAIYQANKKLNLLNSITRHDIMNKLTILIGYLELTKEKEHKDQEIVQFLNNGLEAAEAIRQQILFTKFYQDIGVNNAIWQDVGDTIRTAVKSLNCKGLTITIDLPAVEIFADPLLQKVFYNLVENSIRHGDTLTQVTFSSREQGGTFSIICGDNGTGVPDDVKEKIFRREYFKNTGIGLFLTREILGITNILIFENGVQGEGARFEITVPNGAWRYKAS